ncbi:MAG: FMN-binding protein [Lachnospiraceae bacterium]|nr:FMN-binding protein [Lachnospiraceae bacterium]
MRNRKIYLAAVSLCLFLFLTGCGSNQMKDGYYTAEMSDFSYGWKEYVCIYVKNDQIISVEFNAKDVNGFIKAWDNEYMRNMMTYSENGMYPNKYAREYAQQLIDGQKEMQLDAISGASESGDNFKKLAVAVVEQAKKGDSSAAIVPSAE